METDHKETESEQNLKRNFKDRFLIPFGVPIVAIAVVALLGVSFSRIFLAGAGGGDHGEATAVAQETSKSSAPVMWATIITLVVLLGAAGISLMRRMRASSFRLLVIAAIGVVVLSGSVLYSSGELEEASANVGQPTPEELAAADPANSIEVDALGSLTFQSSEFTAKAGVVTINYIGKGGSHLLNIKDPRYNWFSLVVNDTSTDTGAVVLESGEYTIFCPIPGHEKMTATLKVQ